MNKKLSILLISVVLLTCFIGKVIADNSDFEVTITPINEIILEDEIAEYNLTIFNNNDFEERFQNPYTGDTEWVLTTEPLVDYVPAKTKVSYVLSIDPKTEVAPGQYSITLNVKSLITQEQRKTDFLIFIKPINPSPVEYVKSIALNVETPLKIDPREDVPLSIYLRNRNARSYSNLTIKIESNLINKEYNLKVSALDERTDKFSFKLDDYTSPQEDKLTITIYDGKEIINQVKVPIKVIEYTEIKENKVIHEGFLKTETILTLTNLGNIKNNDPYKYKLDFVKDLFTKTVPINTYITKEDERYLTFPKNLGPGESIQLTITTSYRFAFYGIIILIIILTFYYQLRSPITVKKEAHAHEQSENGVSDFKVKILIRNRSQKPVENVKVIEMVPSLATLLKENQIGTLEPSKIMRNDKSGTLVRWDINYLEPFEERIITYKIRSKLNIVGGLTLQPTKVKFEMINGKERVTYSKKHTIKLIH